MVGPTDLRTDKPFLIEFFLTDDSKTVESEKVDDWKSDGCCKILKNMTSVTCIMLIR